MKKSDSNTYFVVYGALIAALYTALTAALAPISFGAVQFRVSEALCVLPYFTPAAVPGVFAGCLLSNLLCGAAVPDVIFGSLATLIGGDRLLRAQKKPFSGMPATDSVQHDYHPLGACGLPTAPRI